MDNDFLELDFWWDIFKKILIIFLVLGFLVIIKCLIPSDYPKNKEKLNYENLKTGDILTCCYKSPIGYFISFWSNSVYSHTGIVYRRQSDNKLFVVEGANYNYELKKKKKKKLDLLNLDFTLNDNEEENIIYNNFFMIPIELWFKKNRKHILTLTQYQGPKISDEQIEKAFSTVKDKKLDYLTPEWRRLLRKEKYSPHDRERYVCYEMTVHMLQEMGIVKKKYLPSAYWSKHIAEGKLDYEDGYKYSKPIILNHNVEK